MSSASQTSAVTIPTLRVASLQGWFDLKLTELWHSRELLYFFVWRDIKIRYKQTAIGAACAVLQPVLPMIKFTAYGCEIKPSHFSWTKTSVRSLDLIHVMTRASKLFGEATAA